jgi:HK97 family phage portal protein
VWNTLVNRWSERHESTRRAHKVAVLDDGMKFETISSTPREASFPELKKGIRDAIFVGLGVPPTLAGVPDVANYSTARVAQSIFYDSTIAPKLRKIADVIDQKIVEDQDPALMGAFDTSIAPINIVKLSANSRIIARLVQAKLITPNEARALLGMPPIIESQKPYLLEEDRKPKFSPDNPEAMGEAESSGEGEDEGDKGDKALRFRKR